MAEEFVSSEFTEFEPADRPDLNSTVSYGYDGHTIEVEPSEFLDTPKVDPDRISQAVSGFDGAEDFEQEARKMAFKMLPIFLKNSGLFLNKPYITDDFSNHEARRGWREKLETVGVEGSQNDVLPLKDIYKNNCLAINSFNHLAPSLRSLIHGRIFDNIAGAKELAEAVDGSLNIHGDAYDKMNTKEKVKYVKELKKNLYELLLILSKV